MGTRGLEFQCCTECITREIRVTLNEKQTTHCFVTREQSFLKAALHPWMQMQHYVLRQCSNVLIFIRICAGSVSVVV